LRNRRVLLSATVVAINLLIQSAPVSSADENAKQVATADIATKRTIYAIGRAPVRVQSNPDCPCSFTTENKIGRQGEYGTLLSIDSIFLKGKTEREIEKLLEGPLGSSVEIGGLDSYFAPKTIKVAFKQRGRANGEALKDLNQTILLLDYERNIFDGDSSRVEDAEAQNLDLITRAYCKVSVEGASSLPGPKSFAIGAVAARAVIVSDMIGDLAASDQYLQLVLKNPEFDWRFDDVSTDSYKLVTHLVKTGRVREAETLCRDVLEIAARENEKQRVGFNPGRRNLEALRELLLQVLMAKKSEKPNKEALAVATALFEDIGPIENYWEGDSMKWLAKSLEELGDFARASQVYEHRLKREQLKGVPNEDSHPGLQRVRNYCSDAYNIARLQEKLGQSEQASQIAEKALENYNTFLKPEQQTFAEQLDEYFPDGSDLELLLARLYLNSKKFALAQDFAQKAVRRIETALGEKSAILTKALDLSALAADGAGQRSAAAEARKRLVSLERPSSFVETSDAEKFVLLRAAIAAVEKGDLGTRTIDRLVEIYDTEGPVHDWNRRPLNLFAALIGLSRRLSDRGRFAESDALLNKIAVIAARDEFTPVACKFIDVEKNYNQTRSKKGAQVAWPQLAAKRVVSQMVQECGIIAETAKLLSANLSEQENFRALAEIYGDGGEAKRAAFFVDRALAVSDRARADVHAGGDVASSLVSRTKIILLLDAARVRARAGQQEEAHKLGEQAVSLCAATAPDRGRDGRSFNEMYRFKVVELATILRDNGDSDKAVAQFLKDARAKLESGATADMPIDERVSRLSGGFYSLIDDYLAQLLFSSGQVKEALPVVRKAVEECGNNVRGSLRYLAGEIMEANHLYGEAARQYIEGSQFGSMNIPIYQRQMELISLRAAATCAEKDNTMKDSERANIYMRLASSLEGEAPKQALKLYQNASALIPDSEQGKSRLVQRMNNLKSTILMLEKTAAVEKNIAGQPAQQATQPTPEETRALEISSAKAGVEAEREQAVLNENSGQPNAAFSWFQLAQTEANAEMPEKAVEDFRHGLKIYQKTTDSLGFNSGMLSSHSDTIPLLWLANSLSKVGHAKDGEDLIQESIQATTRAFGSDSPVMAYQLAQLFSFYIEQKRDADALKVLDQLLDLNMSILDVGQTGAREQLKTAVQGLVGDNRKALAFKILDKELIAEKKSLDPDDKRIADTLTEIAKLQDDAGHSGEAEKNLTDALTIYTKYVGAINLASTPGAYIVQIWKRNGQADADKSVVLRHLRVNTALLRKFGNTSLADRIEKDDKWPEGLVDPTHSQENRQLIARDASTTEKMDWWQKDLKEACIETPYSRRAAIAAGTLMNLALQQRNWKLLAESATCAAEIYEHTLDISAGRSFGCTPPDHTRMQYYSDAILAYVHMDKLDEAQKWIDRADKHMACKTCYEYIQLAMHELDCGDRVKAQKFAEMSDANFTDQYAAVVPQQSLTVWKQLGHPERGAALVRKAAEFQAKSDAQSKRAQDSAFKYVGF
jgi:hypothetical protein